MAGLDAVFAEAVAHRVLKGGGALVVGLRDGCGDDGAAAEAALGEEGAVESDGGGPVGAGFVRGEVGGHASAEGSFL